MTINRTIEIDRGYDAIRKRLVQVRGSNVRVGWPKEKNPDHEGTDLTMAELAAVHEFGTKDGRIPARSTIRVIANKNELKYRAKLRRLFAKVIDGAITLEHALNALGSEIELDLKNEITNLKSPSLKQATINRKANKSQLNRTVPSGDFAGKQKKDKYKAPASQGGDAGNPLIDTGAMRGAVTYVVEVKR